MHTFASVEFPPSRQVDPSFVSYLFDAHTYTQVLVLADNSLTAAAALQAPSLSRSCVVDLFSPLRRIPGAVEGKRQSAVVS